MIMMMMIVVMKIMLGYLLSGSKWEEEDGASSWWQRQPGNSDKRRTRETRSDRLGAGERSTFIHTNTQRETGSDTHRTWMDAHVNNYGYKHNLRLFALLIHVYKVKPTWVSVSLCCRTSYRRHLKMKFLLLTNEKFHVKTASVISSNSWSLQFLRTKCICWTLFSEAD